MATDGTRAAATNVRQSLRTSTDDFSFSRPRASERSIARRFGGLHYVPFVSGRSPCWIHRSFSLMFPGSICQWVLELTRRYLVRAKSPPWSYAFAIHKAYLYPRRAAPFSHRIYPVNAGGIKKKKARTELCEHTDRGDQVPWFQA